MATDQQFEDFVTATHDLYAAMRRNRAQLARDTGGLSLSQLALLDAVATDGPLPVGEIATQAGVSGPNATRMLKQLEQSGVVTRTRSPEDERKVVVALTPEGRTLYTQNRKALRASQQAHWSTLTPTQRTQFVKVLQQMAVMIPDWVPAPPTEGQPPPHQ